MSKKKQKKNIELTLTILDEWQKYMLAKKED